MFDVDIVLINKKDYKEYHDNANVHFVISMVAKDMQKAEEQGLLEFFKLTSKLTTSNMICFDFEGKIKKYDSPEEIIEEFYPVRLAYYQKRKVCYYSDIKFTTTKSSSSDRTFSLVNLITPSTSSITKLGSSR